jgi:hypothetical protein
MNFSPKISHSKDIYNTSGMFTEKVGKLTEDGTVKDTSSVLNKKNC